MQFKQFSKLIFTFNLLLREGIPTIAVLVPEQKVRATGRVLLDHLCQTTRPSLTGCLTYRHEGGLPAEKPSLGRPGGLSLFRNWKKQDERLKKRRYDDVTIK